MSLAFTGVGGLFTRLGRILKVAYTLTPQQAGYPALFDGVFAQYTSSLQAVGGQVEQLAGGLVRASSGVMGFAQSVAQQTVLQMVAADQPTQGGDLGTALTEVIRQMKAGGFYVTPNAVTLAQAQLPNFAGSGVLVLSPLRGDGLVNELAVAEVPRLSCTADAYTGGATQGREGFTLACPPAAAGTWDYDFPTGSGAQASVQAVSADDAGNPGGSLLTNGNFATWSADAIPALQSWTLTGAWGADAQQLTPGFRGTFAVQFLASGAANVALSQTFAGQTPVTPPALRSHAVNLWLRKASGTITAGVLQVALVDGSGAVISDQQGAANSFTVALNTLTTSYAAYNGVFRLPANAPASVSLQLKLTTPLAGGTVAADDVCCTPLTGFYQGGPGFAVFSGATPFLQADAWSVTVTNSQGGASYLGTFQTGVDRLLGLKGYNLLLPSTGTTLLSNSLISS